MRATYSPSTCGIHHMSLRQGFRSFSAKRRRTVSREMPSCSVRRTSSPASSSSVQRARPTGGLEQAVATSRASSLPESLRVAPGRGSSRSAASRLPSTKRCLVRYTVEPPTPTLLAISASPMPASAASKICARLSLRAECLPPLKSAVSSPRSAWLHPIAYIHLCLLLRHRRTTESDGRREPPCKSLHAQAGPVSGVYPPLHAPAPSAAGRNRHAAILPRQPAFGSPDGAHPQTGRVHQAATQDRTQYRTAR